jgi:hypothetical protein
LRDELVDERVGRAPHAQRAGEQDRRLELSELVHLREADQLAERVADVHRGRHAVEEGIAGVRQDRRHASADRVAHGERRMADAHPRDVGDGVVRAGREDPRLDAEVARPRPGGLGGGGERAGEREHEQDWTHA